MVKRRPRIGSISLAVVTCVVVAVTGTAARASTDTDTTALRNAVSATGIKAHLQELQNIANANGGTRASGSPGFDASANYVAGQLEAAGYQVSRQAFTFDFFEETAPPSFTRSSPTAHIYIAGDDFLTMDYSANASATGTVAAVDLVLPPTPNSSSTSGCEAADFAGFTPGNIALIQRGTCTFAQKAENAEAAGASAAIIFNEGNPNDPSRIPLFGGTLGQPVGTIPVISTSFAVGNELAGLSGAVVSVTTHTFTEPRTTQNVIADTPGGRADRTVVVGAHLDSVPAGPGINDNGSGTATNLEIALQMAELGIQPYNKVRFAFWGAEEAGLLGAEHYVASLTKPELKNIMVNLNFDMVGSPNYVRFVYDGDGSDTATAGPQGSARVEQLFLDYFASQNLPTEPTAFDGRSDYGPFIDAGIPAGGLFTGAEGIKSAEEAAIYGGTAGIAYDPCYHQACDTFANLNDDALNQMGDATAHLVLVFAMTTSAVNGTGKASDKATSNFTFKGSLAQR